MSDPKNYDDILKWVEKIARQFGADDVRSVLQEMSDFTLTQRDDAVEKIEEAIQSSLRVEIFKDHRYSYHSTNDLRPERLEKFLDKAVAMTTYLGEDKDRMLPPRDLYPSDISKINLDLVDATIETLSLEEKKNMTNRMVNRAYAKNKALISVTSNFYNGESTLFMRASNGFFGKEKRTYVSMSVEVSLEEPDGRKPEAWESISACHYQDLWEPEKVAENAVMRVEQKRGAEKISSGKKTMVVENIAVPRLLYPILVAMTGRYLAQKQSFLDGQLHQKVGSNLLTVINDPFIPRALGSRHFDEEGIKAQKRTFFEEGILKNYLIDTYYGNKLGMNPTSGSFSNLILNPGTKSPEDLIKSIEDGIYVTQFIGGNFNSNTGDFSYGIMGHEIKQGTLVRPVTEMNISGNYSTLMESLIAVGNDPYLFSSFRMPTLVFQEVDFSGI